MRLLPFILVFLSGCFWVNDAEYAQRFDLDGDGVSRPLDCDDGDALVGQETTFYGDSDGDGYGGLLLQIGCEAPEGYVAESGDCLDSDPRVHPDAEEVCNDRDDNCDGIVDEGVEAQTWYRDDDGDEYGADGAGIVACEAPWGFVADASDCDDQSSSVNPGAQETCSGSDDDCDGLTDADDPDMTGEATWYPDDDGDGWGTALDSVTQCDQPQGYSRDTGDCNDADVGVHPGLIDVCDDGIDQDCDGTADNTILPVSWFADTDGDGFGDAENTTVSFDCSAPDGHVSNSADCDDAAIDVNPGAFEVCDGIDNDCDGLADDDDPDVVDQVSSFVDGDGDGYGDVTEQVDSCLTPPGHVADDSDCDDADASVNVDAVEVCDGSDNDCDGDADDADPDVADQTNWHPDDDVDGFGSADQTTTACLAPLDWVEDGTDCDDADSGSNPGAQDLCSDGIDQDCNGVVDDTVLPATYWRDADDDGYGDVADALVSPECTPPVGFVANDDDCDDSDGGINPLGNEVCNGIDDDCDGLLDDLDPGVTGGTTTWYADADADGFGDLDSPDGACAQPPGFVAILGDCNDGNGAVNPSATELCNGIDDNCDGVADENTAADALDWFVDGDGDGFGVSSASDLRSCTQPVGFVTSNTDCDDGDSGSNPAEVEVPYDGRDNDCVAGDACDVDGDGFDATACGANDCDDDDVAINPTAAEIDFNGIDEDCDGVDGGACDGDGDGHDAVTCAGGDDCNDTDSAINPSVAEVPYDGVDNDCVGGDECDVDGDGHDQNGGACGGDDCDDGDATANPTGVEVPYDGVDNDCVGGDECDVDGDMALEAGTFCLGADCDDGDPARSPLFLEICGDGIDNDCNLAVEPCGLSGDFDLAFAEGRPSGEAKNQRVGWAVGPLGDMDGDGLDDFVVGARDWTNSPGDKVGAANIFYTTPSGALPATGSDASTVGESHGDQFGHSVSGRGDVDGDGVPDLIVGAPRNDRAGGDSGTAYVFQGPVSSTDGSTAYIKLTGEAGDQAGFDVALGGDATGDAIGDILVGAPRNDLGGGDSGAAFLVFGGGVSGPVAVASAADAVFVGELSGDRAGFAVDWAGDVDGDGLDDVLVGANEMNALGGNDGRAYVLLAPLGGTISLAGADTVLTAADSGDRAASAVTGAGDLDDDGLSDFAIGAPQNDALAGNAGAAYVWYGSPSLPAAASLSSSPTVLLGEVGSDLAGTSVASAGDTNGDGVPELLVGAPESDVSGGKAGATYLVIRPPLGTSSLGAADARFLGEAAPSLSGFAVSTAGDVDGDLYADILIGAPGFKAGGQNNSGATYLLLGGP